MPDSGSEWEAMQITLAHRERQIDAIRRMSDALFSHPSVETMVRETLRIALDVLCADAGSVLLYDPVRKSLVFRYVIGGGGEQLIGTTIPATSGVAGTVFHTGRSVLAGDVADRPDFNPDVDERYGYKTESMMTVPVKRTDAAPIGVMQVLNARNPPFTERDLEVLEVLCAQAATGIEHARLTESSRRAEVVNLIGDISHDIKNMMTPILSGAWTLQPMLDRLFADLDQLSAACPDSETWAGDIRRIADAVRHDYGWMLQNAVSAAELAQARTKEIADAIKGEMAPPLFEIGDLNETCHQVAQTLRTVAAKHQVHLMLELDAALPPVEFDRGQMYNALYNLVNNALPETPPGGTVTVRTMPDPEDETAIRIQVQDTGRGIPEHVRVRLFTDQAVSTKKGGTGLGTRIVAGVVRRHNGVITVESEPGMGSTFTIRIPLRHSELSDNLP